MLPDQTLCLFTQGTHKTRLSLALGSNRPAPFTGEGEAGEDN